MHVVCVWGRHGTARAKLPLCSADAPLCKHPQALPFDPGLHKEQGMKVPASSAVRYKARLFKGNSTINTIDVKLRNWHQLQMAELL